MAQYKRRIYLINPKFQFKYALLVCLFVVVATFVYPWTIFDIFTSIKQYVQPEIDVDAQRNSLLILLGIVEFVILMIVCIVMLFLTHRIAGPMYKLINTFKEIKAGGPLKRIYFRKGDNFHEVAHAYNEAIEVLQARFDYSAQDLHEVLETLKSVKQDVPEIKEAIIKLDLFLCDASNAPEENKDSEKPSKSDSE